LLRRVAKELEVLETHARAQTDCIGVLCTLKLGRSIFALRNSSSYCLGSRGFSDVVDIVCGVPLAVGTLRCFNHDPVRAGVEDKVKL